MSSSVKVLETWNRRLHYYLGLYFLFFLWLFSVTGLLLNHQQWLTGVNDRQQTTYQFPIETADGQTPTAQARDVMRQLELKGEIDWPASQPVGHIDFNVSRPTGSAQVRVDLNAKTAYVRQFDNNPKLAFQVLHTFSGSRFTQPSSRRDWNVTTAWVLAMDALAAGLVIMVFGSYYMWWQIRKKRVLGTVSLAAGIVACGVFVAGLL